MDDTQSGLLNAVVRVAPARNVGWHPPSGAGLSVHYSTSRDAVVLHGGVTPGHGRTADIVVGALQTPAGACACATGARSCSS